MVSSSTRRDPVLDFLRGYLLFVIVVNHMRDEPNLYMFLTGGARLWVSAAEGFVLISGFLIGKLRGDEARAVGLAPVARKLLRRAATLALWTVIVTDVLLIASAAGIATLVPDSPRQDLPTLPRILLAQVLGYVHGDQKILAAYALFLAVAPLVLWGLLRGRAWLVGGVSVVLWLVGLLTPEPLGLTDAYVADLSWQLLFVIGVAGGFHHPALERRWRGLSPAARRAAIAVCFVTAAVTLALSWWRRFHEPAPAIEHMLFAHVRLGPGRVLLAVLWMLVGYAVVHRLRRWLLPTLGPFFVPLGQSSLYVFLVHALLLFPFVGLAEGQPWLATLHITAALAAIWTLVRYRVLFGIIPR